MRIGSTLKRLTRKLLTGFLVCVAPALALSQAPPGQFSYSFNVPDGTLVSAAAPELVVDPYLVINSNRLNGSLTWWGSASLVHPSVTANQIVQFKIAGAVNGYTYIRLRYSYSSTTYSANQYYLNFTNTGVSLYKGAGWTNTLLGSSLTSIATGDTIKATAVGNDIKVFINNQLKITVNDASYPTGGVGFALYDGSNSLDDLVIGSFRAFTPPPEPPGPPMPSVVITPTPNPPPTAAFIAQFAQAKPFANDQNLLVPNFLSAGSAAAVVPNYGGATPQTSLYAAGQGSTAAPGVGRAVDCEINPQTGTPYTLQECDAIRFMRQSPGARPQFTVNRANAFIAGTEAYKVNPESALGTNALAGSYSACVPTTQTTPPSTRTEICNDYSTLGNTMCSVGRTITVDPHNLYQCVEQLFTLTGPTCKIPREVDFDVFQNWQCVQTPNTLSNQTCRRTRLITVTNQDSCALATVTHESGFPFEYNYRRGLDLYYNGGVARVYCNYLTENKIDLRMFYGDVVQGQYGSGAVYAPPPNLSLLPNNVGAMQVNTAEPVDRVIGSTGSFDVWVQAGGQCAAAPLGQAPVCTFTIYLRQPYSTYEVCNEGGCFQQPVCTPDENGYCPLVDSTTMTFNKPTQLVIVNESIDNQCVGLEARQ
jgi:hypothetical protein